MSQGTSSEGPLTHDLIICTRNRPGDLAAAMTTVEAQTRPFDSVLVVDSSDTDESELLVRASERGGRYRYVRSPPGLTVQRNRGVQHSRADVIHFVDDDVLLEKDYLGSLAATFEAPDAGDVVGAGGIITNLPERHPRLWWRVALMDSRREGVVLPSGINTLVSEADQPKRVQWLSGCSMSYRRSLFESLSFDETLGGYGLMEDVDFSVRAARTGRLLVTPHARLVHNVSPVERWDFQRRTRASVYRRGWFVEKNLPRRCRAAFWWSVVAGTALSAALAIGTGSRWRMRIAGWQVLGAKDFLQGKR